jgi:tetratricopeptide (TPR) repeat protein
VHRLIDCLSRDGIDASELTALWDSAFAAGTPAGYVVPRQLPSPVRHFVGREAELAVLIALACQADASLGPVMAVLEGTAGAGKTTLAIQAAHAVSDRFPDGQLYMNLRGFDPAGGPMPAGEALSGLLTALGAGQPSSPLSVEELAALYRTALVGKRVLVLLDNARDASQVRCLLPGGPGSLVLVTSRNQLCALAGVGALPVRVQPFTVAEAREMLTVRLGSDRVSGELGAADEIGSLCAGLPLALSVVAAHAHIRPGFSLTAVAGEFRSRGLDLLETGDPMTTARHVFSWSYQYLSEEATRVFRLLGAVPGPDVPVPAAASLTAMPPVKVYTALDELARAHLAEEHKPGRFRFHDLLRTYAAELAACTDAAGEPQEAMRRLLDHHLHSALSALNKFRPPKELLQPGPLLPGVMPVPVTGLDDAIAWYEAEIPGLLALVSYADANVFDEYAWQIPGTIASYLRWSGRHQDLLATQRVAVSAAARTGDPLAQAHSHLHMSFALYRMGDHTAALPHIEQSLNLFRELGDHGHEAMAVNGLANLLEEQGRIADALDVALDGLQLVKAAHCWWVETSLEANCGWLYALLEQYDLAVSHCERSIARRRAEGHHAVTAPALHTLGKIQARRGDLTQAMTCYRQAAELYRDCNAAFDEALALADLGDALTAASPRSDALTAMGAARLE